MKKHITNSILTLTILFLMSFAVNADNIFYTGPVTQNQPVYINQKIFALTNPLTVNLSIPCNVILTPTYLLGLGRNYNYPIVIHENTTTFALTQRIIYNIEIIPLKSGTITITTIPQN